MHKPDTVAGIVWRLLQELWSATTELLCELRGFSEYCAPQTQDTYGSSNYSRIIFSDSGVAMELSPY
jgi:hypothetical protein